MNILVRKKLDRVIHLCRGDTLNVMKDEEVLVSTTLTQVMSVDEAVVFETEIEGRRAIGGAVMEKQS